MSEPRLVADATNFKFCGPETDFLSQSFETLNGGRKFSAVCQPTYGEAFSVGHPEADLVKFCGGGQRFDAADEFGHFVKIVGGGGEKTLSQHHSSWTELELWCEC